ncbi:MAG TPA: M48 family metallopeptidase [Actinomycetota bacterium]
MLEVLMRAGPLEEFTSEQVDRARRYHRPLYVAALVDLALSLGTLGVLAFGGPGDRVDRALHGLPWWAWALVFSLIVVAVPFVIRLPLSFWRGYVREKAWGFSTQELPGWVADRLKGLAVGAVLTATAMVGFVGLARVLPRAWPLAVAPAGAGLIMALSFVAPVLLEPLFNRFSPLADPELSESLRTLSRRAGVPVRDVLVADASRRTRKENAYVSGLGRTRRVVVYDTLLSRGGPGEVRLVVAHELGHRRLRHVVRATALAVAAMTVAIAALWGLLRTHAVLGAVGAAGPGDPRVIPFVLFVAAALQMVALPFESALSRRWESAADRFSLELTGDLEAFVASHRGLAVSNLLDLDPPRLVYVLAFSHPTPPERIAAARRWASELGAVAPIQPPRSTTA